MNQKPILEFGSFRLNTSERVLEKDGAPIGIAPKALDVLIVLVESRGRLVEKDRLMREVWPDTFVEENNLAFNISVLRKALGENSLATGFIETVPKRGYRFIAEVRELPIGPPGLPSTLASPVSSFFRPLMLAGACAVIVVLGIFGYRVYGAGKLSNKDVVVIADFENKTGDPAFEGTLRPALGVALEQSPFLSVLSEQRIQQTLRLMRRSGDKILTPELAHGICERTGSNVVLEGSIEQFGSNYVLGLRVTNCGGAQILKNEQVQVGKKEDVPDALTQIAQSFRSRAGEPENTIRAHDVPLAEATTASLDAWRAYTNGWQIHAAEGATMSLPFFVRAAELDPEFAMAHATLGRIYADLDQPELSAKSVIKGWELRERVSDHEKFFILANYYMLVTGNMEEARKTGEVWTRTYPRDAAPHMMLSGMVNKIPGRYDAGVAEAHAAVALDPDFAIAYYNEAVNNAYLGQLDRAEEALRKASARGFSADEFLMLAHDIAFLKGDSARMQQVAEQARANAGSHSWISNKEAFVEAYSGRLQKARSLSRRAVAEALEGQQQERAGLWEAGAAVREALLGNYLLATQRAESALNLASDRDVKYGVALALAIAKNSARAEAIATELDKKFPEDTSLQFNSLPVLRAILASNHGEHAKGLELLDAAVPFELGIPRSAISGQFGALYPCYIRGSLYLALGQGEQAAGEFRKIVNHREIVLTDPIGALAHLQLGRALAAAGNRVDAKTAYRDFLALWKDADAGIPNLQQAREELKKLQGK